MASVMGTMECHLGPQPLEELAMRLDQSSLEAGRCPHSLVQKGSLSPAPQPGSDAPTPQAPSPVHTWLWGGSGGASTWRGAPSPKVVLPRAPPPLFPLLSETWALLRDGGLLVPLSPEKGLPGSQQQRPLPIGDFLHECKTKWG